MTELSCSYINLSFYIYQAVDEMGKTFEQNNITIKISTSFRRFDDIADNLIAIKVTHSVYKYIKN